MIGVDADDCQAVFAAVPGCFIVLDHDFMIRAASDAYVQVSGVERPALINRYIFEVFPDNPALPGASGVRNLTASLNRVRVLKRSDAMPLQRYDVRAHGLDGENPVFEERYWQPLNSPVFGGDGEVRWIVHSVEDVTETILARRRTRQTRLPVERRRIIEQLRPYNGLLNALADNLFDLIADDLRPVEIAAGTVLVEALEPVKKVYFPLEGLNAIVRRLEDGSSAEIAVGGRAGMAGIAVLLGDTSEEAETVAVIGGCALEMDAGQLSEILMANPDLRMALYPFVSMLVGQLGLSAACIARHTIDQRLARWLLTASQRLGRADLELSQESIAGLLGIRRAGVSEALGRFAAASLVSVARGRVTIRDRRRLENESCECFQQGEAERHRHAPQFTGPLASAPQNLRAIVRKFSAVTATK
ncbi:MAG: helix-turn-helix domain-containing protein [Phenylobacterium sp.]